MTPVTTSAAETVKQCATPVFTAVENKMRDACDTVQDRVAQTRIQVRRHPFVSVGAVAGVAAVLGCVIGFIAGRRGQPSL
jgi:ElaB/YqjD/DUF883 family membrane-anchored ribosome-binding protein